MRVERDVGIACSDGVWLMHVQRFASKTVLRRYLRYRSLVFTEQELAVMGTLIVCPSGYFRTNWNYDHLCPCLCTDGVPASAIPPPASGAAAVPLLYALRHVDFCIDDLLDQTRAAELRDRLVDLDKIDLARRVWVECEVRVYASC